MIDLISGQIDESSIFISFIALSELFSQLLPTRSPSHTFYANNVAYWTNPSLSRIFPFPHQTSHIRPTNAVLFDPPQSSIQSFTS
jgi:hypothetical protein